VGHNRLAVLPDTAPWRQTVGLIADGADVADVAAATTEAAAKGLIEARRDRGVSYPLYLLTQVVLAARSPDFVEALRRAGVDAPDAPDVFDLTSGLSDAVDRQFRRLGRTDLGDLAQLAAVEAFSAVLGRGSANLFDITPVEVQRSVYSMSTGAGFAALGHEFCTRLTERFLTYHLGRELGLHVGGNGRFGDTDAHDEFVQQLAIHCREAAAITRTYAGDWYSKYGPRGLIDEDRAKRFVRHCLGKLRRELLRRGDRDV
jgi:hypothetical protein